ncbi:MAG: hypothetical protein Q7O66_20860 [Dehalococcoidia bacterium]|nr:hypothetical protein [Dehalococcoidia bacterium]
MRSRLILAGVGVVLILTSFIQPFTYVPNVLGAYYIFSGGYDYDPRSPFVNRFASGGPPEATLRPQLERLIGATGLDPLDVASPLAAYEFLYADLPGRNGFGAWVKVRMTYADGSQRTYDIPTTHRLHHFDSWLFTGLDRLFAEHVPLGDIPFGTTTDPVRFSRVERLDITETAHKLGSGVMPSWTSGYVGWGDPLPLRWSPKGDAFLANWGVPPSFHPSIRTELWLVTIDGGEPVRVGTNVADFRFTPDGERVLFSRRDRNRESEIVSVNREGKDEQVLASTDNASGMFDIADGSLVYANRDAVWRQPLSSQSREPELLQTLSGAKSDFGWYQTAFRLSPDGERLAYVDRSHLTIAG